MQSDGSVRKMAGWLGTLVYFTVPVKEKKSSERAYLFCFIVHDKIQGGRNLKQLVTLQSAMNLYC